MTNPSLLPCPLCGREPEFMADFLGAEISCNHGAPKDMGTLTVVWSSKPMLNPERAAKINANAAIKRWNSRYTPGSRDDRD